MTIQQLNNNLTQLLKKEIRAKKHVKSGKLLSSISFNCTDDNGGVRIKLETAEYILYLEDGKFWDNFVNSDDVAEEIATYIQDNLFDTLEFK